MKKQFNPFKDIQLVEKNGKIFTLHWRYRFGPLPLAMGAMAAGTGVSMYGSIKGGQQAQKIANYNAKVEEQNATFAKQSAIEQAKIQAEKGLRLLASQKVGFAASGVKMNVGAPLVIEAQTKADIAKDMTFTINQGEMAYAQGMNQAAITRKQGSVAKRQSYWDAAGTGLMGLGSLAYMGYKGGLFESDFTPEGKAALLKY